METVKTVSNHAGLLFTRLKPGVNENDFEKKPRTTALQMRLRRGCSHFLVAVIRNRELLNLSAAFDYFHDFRVAEIPLYRG